MKPCKAFLVLSLVTCGFATAFTVSKPSLRQKIQLHESVNNDQGMQSRRAVLGGVFAATLLTGVKPVMAQDEIPITPFNGLIFNYRGSDYGGLDASTLSEPSVPYKEFAERLVKGEVHFVEFMAPDGDVAYVTFKSGDASSKPIRIGEVRCVAIPTMCGCCCSLHFIFGSHPFSYLTYMCVGLSD
jgi:hypothetical protein